MNETNGNGYRIPGWSVAAVMAIFAIVGVAWNLFSIRQQDVDRITTNRIAIMELQRVTSEINFRLCRLEQAQKVSPYPTCPTIPVLPAELHQ